MKNKMLLCATALLLVGGLASCSNESANGEKTTDIIQKSNDVCNDCQEEAIREEDKFIDFEAIKPVVGTYSSNLYYNYSEKTSEDIYYLMLNNSLTYLYEVATTDLDLDYSVLRDILSYEVYAYHTDKVNYASIGSVFYDFEERHEIVFEDLDLTVKYDEKTTEFVFTKKDCMPPAGSYGSESYYNGVAKSSNEIYELMLNKANSYLLDSIICDCYNEETLKDILSTDFVAYHTDVDNWYTNYAPYYALTK